MAVISTVAQYVDYLNFDRVTPQFVLTQVNGTKLVTADQRLAFASFALSEEYSMLKVILPSSGADSVFIKYFARINRTVDEDGVVSGNFQTVDAKLGEELLEIIRANKTRASKTTFHPKEVDSSIGARVAMHAL